MACSTKRATSYGEHQGPAAGNYRCRERNQQTLGLSFENLVNDGAFGTNGEYAINVNA